MIERVVAHTSTRENMLGVICLDSVQVMRREDIKEEDFSGKEFFEEDAEEQIKEFVAGKLKVSKDIIEIYNESFETPWDD